MEEKNIGSIWFEQEGTTCHAAEATFDVLRPVSEDRIISRKADVVSPPVCFDLTPLDYYLLSAVKPETIEALEDNIHEVIGEIRLRTHS